MNADLSPSPESSPITDEDTNSATDTRLMLEIPLTLAGLRVDSAIARLLPQHSRSAIQQWLRADLVLLGEKVLKPKDRLFGGEQLDITIPAPEPAEWLAQEMPLEIIYSDPDLFVINKSAGLVVHPGAGNPDLTLLNGLLHLDPSLRVLPRAGIVHRLDKDTSGLMVVARSELARQSLIEQLRQRSVSRRYLAITHGVPITGETIDQPIGRHRIDRLRMAVTDKGKAAITHIRLVEKFRCHALVEAKLETGRTHQIRVHLTWRGYPLVGDPLYGNRMKQPAGASKALIDGLQGFKRQALHARELALIHPISGETMCWEQQMPQDMLDLIELLQRDQLQ